MNDTASATGALRRALQAADLAGLHSALGAGADPSAAFLNGQAPLEIAIQRKAWRLANALLDAGADPNAADPASGEPGQPLAVLAEAVGAAAMSNGAAALVLRLLSAGCQPDAAIVARGLDAWDSLQAAAKQRVMERDLAAAKRRFRPDQSAQEAALAEARARARQEAVAAARRRNEPVLLNERFATIRAWPSGMFDWFSYERGAWIPEAFVVPEIYR